MDTHCKKLLLLALGLVFSTSVYAQSNVSKKITKNFDLTGSGKLLVENKYGTVNFNGWEKDEVKIEVVVTVNHRKSDNAKDLLARINPTFRESKNFVALGYEIAEKSSNWFANVFEKANPFDYDRSNIQIDYTIYLPKKAELKVTNTFGDVIFEDWTGKLKALVEHGDVWLNDDLNQADITMRYGKLRAQNIRYASFDFRNSGLDMKNATTLRITSSGSDISLNTINSLELYSNKDEIVVAEVAAIYGTLKFTTLQLNKLTKNVDMTMKISDFRVTEIGTPETTIAIEQESSEISLIISGFSHRFEAFLEEGLVRMPKTFKNIDSKLLDKGKKLRVIKASYGKGAPGNISITGRKGVVLLKEN